MQECFISQFVKCFSFPERQKESPLKLKSLTMTAIKLCNFEASPQFAGVEGSIIGPSCVGNLTLDF